MQGQYVIKNIIMCGISNGKHGYLSNEIKGNFIILTDIEHAMSFTTEEEAKKFLKEHKVGKIGKDIEIVKTY